MSKATSGASFILIPHIAEPVIGRAFARPVGSCGLLAGAVADAERSRAARREHRSESGRR